MGALSRLRKQGRLTAGLHAHRARAGRSTSSRPHSALAAYLPCRWQAAFTCNVKVSCSALVLGERTFTTQAPACCAARKGGVLVFLAYWRLRGARCEWQQLVQQRDEALKQQRRLETSRNELARQRGQFKGLIAKALPETNSGQSASGSSFSTPLSGLGRELQAPLTQRERL